MAAGGGGGGAPLLGAARKEAFWAGGTGQSTRGRGGERDGGRFRQGRGSTWAGWGWGGGDGGGIRMWDNSKDLLRLNAGCTVCIGIGLLYIVCI
jgi:hypothetical protein